MKVNKSIETPEGTFVFEGELSVEEVDLIMGVGLNFLLQQGALPFRVTKASKVVAQMSGNDTEN